MEEIALMVVPRPKDETTVVHMRSGTAPVFTGNDRITYRCGSCGLPLVTGISRHDPITRTIRCGRCHEYNRLAERDGGVADGADENMPFS